MDTVPLLLSHLCFDVNGSITSCQDMVLDIIDCCIESMNYVQMADTDVIRFVSAYNMTVLSSGITFLNTSSYMLLPSH